jgi:sporulation protein YlmC with PRC-barrel domain
MIERPMSWMTLQSGTRVATSDGNELGKITQVIADREKGIFSGVAYRPGLIGSELFIPADLIDNITEQEVRLSIPAAEAEQKIKTYDG